MNETFRGHLEECAKHLSLRFLEAFPKGTKKAAKARQPLADFCGVSIHTVADWLMRSTHLPRGDEYIKFVCFLEINGYKVIEHERTPQKRRNFSKLIGFGLLTGKEATEMLGYSQTSSLYGVLKGTLGTSNEVEEKLWDLWKARKDELDEAIESATKKYRLDFSREEDSRVGTREDVSSVAVLRAEPGVGCPKSAALIIMEGLLQLLDSGTFKDMKDADWVAVRTSSNTVLRLSSHLSTLSAQIVKPS